MLSSVFTGSIRKQLLTLFLLAALPAVLFILWTGLRNREEAISRAQQELLLFSRHLAEMQTHTTQETRRLLEDLASLPEVRQADVAACSRLFAQVLRLNPAFAALHLVDPKGDLVASGTARGPANFAQTRHFRDALATRAFTAGEYLVGVTVRVPVFAFGAPVLGDDGGVLGVLLTSLRLDTYGELFNAATFPPDSFVGICDDNGRRLFRHPAKESLPLGAPISASAYQAVSGAEAAGVVVETTSSGAEHFIAYQQLRLTPEGKPYMVIMTGAPRSVVWAQAQAGMTRDLLILLCSLGLSLTSGWFLGGRTLGRRLEAMALAARRLGAGDLDARVGQPSGTSELDDLTVAFNQMAQSLSEDIARRERAEEALRQSRAVLDAALSSMLDAVFISDAQGQLIDFNEAFATFHRYRNKEECYRSVIDYHRVLDVFRENGEPLPLDQWAVPRALRGESATNAVYHVRRKDTGESWIGSYSFGPIRDAGGAIVGSVVVGRDVTALRQAQQAVLASLREKEVLLKEIHHRVKNNLQIIRSLLHLQGERVDNPDALAILNDSQSRVMSMAAVHDQLYKSHDLSAIDVGGYLEALLPAMRSAYGKGRAVEILTDIAPISLNIEQAIPFGLILNELLTNAFKHGFRDRLQGVIRIEARVAGGSVVVRCEDDGVGLPPDFSLDAPASLGLQLVTALTDQLQGTITAHNGPGARFRIVFPLKQR